jgi:hypothetical protein
MPKNPHTEHCDPDFGCDETCAAPLPPEARELAAAELRRVAAAIPHRNLAWMGDVIDGLQAHADALDGGR